MQRFLKPIFNRQLFRFCTKANELQGEVQEIVFQVLKEAQKCNQSKLSLEATFTDLGFDSLDSVVAMEERFNVDIQNEEAEKIVTVNDAVTVFTRYMTEKINRETLNK